MAVSHDADESWTKRKLEKGHFNSVRTQSTAFTDEVLTEISEDVFESCYTDLTHSDLPDFYSASSEISEAQFVPEHSSTIETAGSSRGGGDDLSFDQECHRMVVPDSGRDRSCLIESCWDVPLMGINRPLEAESHTQDSVLPVMLGALRENSRLSGHMLDKFKQVSAAETSGLFAAPRPAFIVFDWDDTLMPTSWVSALRKGLLTIDGDMELQLRAHSKAVLELVRIAASLGTVALVTLGSRRWVKTSFESFLPDLAELDAELDVHFAREVELPCSQNLEVVAAHKKFVSMKAAMEAKVGESCAWSSFVSIGDSLAELCAAQELGKQCIEAGTVDFVKTLKMIEAPNLRTLTAQVRAIADKLPDVVVHAACSNFRVIDWLHQS